MTNYDDLTIEELQSAVEQLSNELTEARTKLREKRLAGVRAAMEARKEADLVLNEELKKSLLQTSLTSGAIFHD